MPDVTDETDPPDDYPHLAGPDVPYDGEPGTLPVDAGGGGGAATLPLGEVIEFNLPGGLKATATEKARFTVKVSNGGTTPDPLANDSAVKVYTRLVTEAGVVEALVSDALEYVGNVGDIDVFASDFAAGGVAVDEEGKLYCAVKVITATGPPETATWYPANIQDTADNYKVCPFARILDPSGASVYSGLTIYAGWVWSGS